MSLSTSSFAFDIYVLKFACLTVDQYVLLWVAILAVGFALLIAPHASSCWVFFVARAVYHMLHDQVI